MKAVFRHARHRAKSPSERMLACPREHWGGGASRCSKTCSSKLLFAASFCSEINNLDMTSLSLYFLPREFVGSVPRKQSAHLEQNHS